MAETALFAIAGTVLEQLGSKVLQEAALLWGLGDDIKKLTCTLSSIQAVLLDAEEQSHSPQSHQLRLWLKELRQVVYDAEDLLDDFSIEVRRRQGKTTTASENISKEVQSFFSSSNQVAYSLKIAHGIQDIRAKLDEIAERRDMFHLEVRPVESMARKLREQTDSDVPEMVVGRKNDKKRVLKQLLLQLPSCEDIVSVVSIVGIGGLGKTTFAQLLYNDKRVESQFKVRAWVCVSDNFDVKLIIEKIIESCTGKKPKDVEMGTLRKILHQTINGKKCLIVLDDVWSEDREKWSRLKGLLKGSAHGSRVVITTRMLKVAKLAATRGIEPYELKGLGESMSWSLFREIAYAGGKVTSRRHEFIGREIVERCKGVPLAIKTVAGALFFKETESEWVAFNHKGMWEMNENENDIMPTLKLSYDHLPTHLKHCFAYCSLFPKDYKINVNTLIHLWIAQGFIPSTDPSDRFDVGLGYFKDLLWGSFFQETKYGGKRDTTHCKMHDLMHDLAVAVAGEESVVLAVSNSQDQQSFDSRLGAARHVSLDLLAWEESHMVFSSVAATNQLRTLIFMNKPSGMNIPWPNSFSNTSLRALDMSRFGMVMVSDTIHKLKHLKYFDLSHNKRIKVLPEEIAELVNLEVLKLDFCWSLLRLPKGLGKLSCLSHLGVDWCTSLAYMPCGIGQLRYLRKMSLFLIAAAAAAAAGEGESVSTDQAARVGELRDLNNLRGRLVIKNLEEVKEPSEGELANLKDKQHLMELGLIWGDRAAAAINAEAQGKLLEALRPHPNLKNLEVGYNHGLECPSWLPSSVTNLVKIKIEGCRNWKSLPSLDQLPFLAKLELNDMPSLEYIEYCPVAPSSSSSFFPSLKSLILMTCPKLEGWRTGTAVEVGAIVLRPQFPCVSEVQIFGCGSIASLPYFSTKLQALRLKGGSKELLKQILRMPPSSSSSLPPPSSSLYSLTIYGVLDLDTLPEETLPRLSCSPLKSLTINDCPVLRTLSPTTPRYFTSLEILDISNCENLDLCDGDGEMMQLQCGVLLPRLVVVNLARIPKLSRLPEWLQLAPELLEIQVIDCPIALLPEWMPKFVRLLRLKITSYAKSASQCVNEDWPKIAHTPFIEINYAIVQKDGQPMPLAVTEEQAPGQEAFDQEEEAQVTEAAAGAAAATPTEEEEEETSGLLPFFMMKCGIFGRCFQV
ncbi:unnamed protein product [Linum tenue]|uniref:Disease resistance protein RGA3 n=1 Tax=Linum tenue TaxID=586396 RepID=A0AAV0KT95_9ROSI|nr:unnamed protein product [Linum tenue]